MNATQEFAHVNIFGEPWKPSAKSVEKVKRPRAQGPATYHKGWRVAGVSIAAVVAAKAKREKDIREADNHNAGVRSGVIRSDRMKVPPVWDEAEWIKSAPLKPIRSKPYEIEESARVCADLARKEGWMRVVVEELRRDGK